LPVELIDAIADLVDYESEINALARTNKDLREVLNRRLYKHNVRHGDSTALAWGIAHHSIETVKLILEAGASPHECDRRMDWRPMALAVYEGQEDIVRLLCEHGVDLRQVRDWVNPRHHDYSSSPAQTMSLLAIAAKRGHEPLVRMLMDYLPRKGDVDFPADRLRRTPLIGAAEMGHLSVVRCLVDAGANLEARDNDDQTPLVHAAKNGRHEVLEFLLSRGADPNVRSFNGATPPISEAAHHGHFECVRCLINADGVMDSLPSLEETSHPLVCATRSRHPAIVDLLLAQPQSYAQLGTNLRAMLCVAAARGDLPAVQGFLENPGCHPNSVIQFVQGSLNGSLTALCLAADRGHTAVVQMLLERGALPSREAILWQEIQKALLQAIYGGFQPIVELLLEAGADPNDEDVFHGTGNPALIAAMSFQGIFQCLLDAGASPGRMNVEETTVVAAVLGSGRTALVQMLLDRELDLPLLMGRRTSFIHQAIGGGRAVFELLLQQQRWDDLLLPENLTSMACEEALSVAATTGRVEMVQFLIDQGFHARLPRPRQVDIFCVAARSMDRPDADPSAIVDLLLRYGEDINQKV
ncbi:ankyrin, partial [Aspergillus fijiensis CBS 313.89]